MSSQLYDQYGDEDIFDNFQYFLYECGTCRGVTLLGGFDIDQGPEDDYKALYPIGSDLLPPSHMLHPSEPVPNTILQLYEEVWPLRYRAPTAFVGQIRRALEFVCKDQKAAGKDLADKLTDLAARGIFPGNISGMTSLIRECGNIASHAADREMDRWDAEIVDALFRTVVEYVYIAPAKVARMRQRLEQQKPDTNPPDST